MLVLSRKPRERIMIGDDISVEVVEVRGDKVRLGIVAPRTVPVHRYEIWMDIQNPKAQSDQPTEPIPAPVTQ